MSSDPNPGRRRATSTSLSTNRTGHKKVASNAVIQPKSQHTSDEFLKDFLSSSFDPVSFLNAKLPPLAPTKPTSSQQQQSPSGAAVPLADLSQQANTLLSQLNAQSTRLSSTLTQLTDDILRSGSRLAYEVELLRGETLNLSETLHETLKEDVKLFVPGGLENGKEETSTSAEADKRPQSNREDSTSSLALPPNVNAVEGDAQEPEYIQQLMTLTKVKERIEAVVKTFGDAMDFVFPPSELSVSSSFLSVSAPEPGSEQQSSEEKGQQVLKSLREEISNLLKNQDDPVAGIEQAANRVEELKELTQVWKGTAEEKGRNKYIDSLAKMVEDRHRELARELQLQQTTARSRNDSATAVGRLARLAGDAAGGTSSGEANKAPPGGFGLISQLQKLRSGLT